MRFDFSPTVASRAWANEMIGRFGDIAHRLGDLDDKTKVGLVRCVDHYVNDMTPEDREKVSLSLCEIVKRELGEQCPPS